MNNVWWAIVRFFQKLFVPPEFTELETFLLRKNDDLLVELRGANEELRTITQRYHSLLERSLFGINAIESRPNQEAPITLEPTVTPTNLYRQKLEAASKRRWDEHIERMEKKAREDEAKSREAQAKAQSSGFQDAH